MPDRTQGFPMALILSSTSRYRRELLSRFRLPFDTASPDVDETPQPGESPAALALLAQLPHVGAPLLGLHRHDLVALGWRQAFQPGAETVRATPGGARRSARRRDGRSTGWRTGRAGSRAARAHTAARRIFSR